MKYLSFRSLSAVCATTFSVLKGTKPHVFCFAVTPYVRLVFPSFRAQRAKMPSCARSTDSQLIWVNTPFFSTNSYGNDFFFIQGPNGVFDLKKNFALIELIERLHASESQVVFSSDFLNRERELAVPCDENESHLVNVKDTYFLQ